jgi:hypothetical protein
MAEIELSVHQRQCLQARIPDRPTLIKKVDAWESQRNASESTVYWRFTTEDVRIKLHKEQRFINLNNLMQRTQRTRRRKEEKK